MAIDEPEIHRSFTESFARSVGPILNEAGFRSLKAIVPHTDRSTSYCPFLRTSDSLVFAFYLDSEMWNLDLAIVVVDEHLNETGWRKYSITGQAGARKAILASHFLELTGRALLTEGCIPSYGKGKFSTVHKARQECFETSMKTVIDCFTRNLQNCGISVLASSVSMMDEMHQFTRDKLDLVLSEDRRTVMSRVAYEYWAAKKKDS